MPDWIFTYLICFKISIYLILCCYCYVCVEVPSIRVLLLCTYNKNVIKVILILILHVPVLK